MTTQLILENNWSWVIDVNYMRQLNELAFDAFIKNDTDIGVAQAFIRIENENITNEERHFRYKVTINNTLKPGNTIWILVFIGL
jgi:hypothetical protein